jgi:hypothetical protein
MDRYLNMRARISERRVGAWLECEHITYHGLVPFPGGTQDVALRRSCVDKQVGLLVALDPPASLDSLNIAQDTAGYEKCRAMCATNVPPYMKQGYPLVSTCAGPGRVHVLGHLQE